MSDQFIEAENKLKIERSANPEKPLKSWLYTDISKLTISFVGGVKVILHADGTYTIAP